MSIGRLVHSFLTARQGKSAEISMVDMRASIVDFATRIGHTHPRYFHFIDESRIRDLFPQISYLDRKFRQASLVSNFSLAGAVGFFIIGVQDGVALSSMVSFSACSGVSGAVREMKLTLDES